MFYKDQKWNECSNTFMKTFGQDVPVFQPSVYREYRGEIFTTFHNKLHPVVEIVGESDNTHVRFSRSRRGVLRGLHYDFSTWKLVQALVGEIYLMVLDMRPDSTTYGRWENYLLTERTRDQILIPPGFANGHLALEDSIFHYTLFYPGQYVDEKNQGVIAYNDPRFEMKWPSMELIIQDRDKITSEIKK
jgi:dTDP-4-dehydrorhamnose 3,5-epimerase